VWLFSSGPLGDKRTDAQGRSLREVTVPREIEGLAESIHPKEHKVFFGAMDHGKLILLHRLVKSLPANKDDALLPEGDFRDWDEIDAWAEGIAQELKGPPQAD
jgi:menaquinone-dependent protoporphyrinogen oxidase